MTAESKEERGSEAVAAPSKPVEQSDEKESGAAAAEKSGGDKKEEAEEVTAAAEKSDGDKKEEVEQTTEAEEPETVESTPATNDKEAEEVEEEKGQEDKKSAVAQPSVPAETEPEGADGNDAAVSSETKSTPTRRLYVGNLSWSVTPPDLREHMARAGAVLTADILTGHDGRSKGCGVVEYGTDEGALRAVRTLNNTDLRGRQIFVREDREEKGTYYAAGAGAGAGGDARRAPARSVYVGNLAYEVAWQDLKDHMRAAGEVVYAEVLELPDGRSKGCGTVQFAEAEQARRAMQTLNNTELKGRMIFVREDREGGPAAPPPNSSSGAAAAADKGGTKEEGSGEPANKSSAAGVASGLNANVVEWKRVGVKSGGADGGATGFLSAAAARKPINGNSKVGTKPTGGGLAVYVGNLTYETSWQDLKDHMRAAGNVDKADILRSEDGRSKGCGIVMYQKQHEASRAMRELQDTELGGRKIFVREDREAQSSAGGGSGGGPRASRGTARRPSRPSGGGEPGASVFVGNVSWETGWPELKDHFKQCGNVVRCDVPAGPNGQASKGYGFVRFGTAAEASEAIGQMNGQEFMGRVLDVKLDKHHE